MALLLAESVAKHWGRGCDISIGTIVIISELMNCIKRRTAIRKVRMQLNKKLRKNPNN